MKANLIQFKDTYQQYPQLTTWKKLYHWGYYDGPLSGLCLVEGQKCWFECLEEWLDYHQYPEGDEDFEPPWFRRFLIWTLDDTILAQVEARHDKFCRMVGTHCNYDDQGSRGNFHYTDKITPETTKQYYQESSQDSPLDLTPRPDQIVGWYQW